MYRDEEDDAANDLRRWLGENDGSQRAGPRGVDDLPRRWTAPRLALALLVLAPWIVLGVLAVTGARGPSPAGRSVGDAGPAAHGTDDQIHAPAHGAPPPSSAPETRGRRTETHGRPTEATEAVTPSGKVPAAVGPTAVRLVRDAVTRTGPRSMALDATAAEAAEALAAGTWAVRVHAVVLRGDRRRWHSATHEVWAAPVGLREGRVVGLDRPWRVATIDDGIAPTNWDRADVDADAVRGALDDAGITYRGDPLVERHPTLPSIVRVSAGEGHRVWVRLRPEPVVVGRRDAERDP